MTMHPLLQRQHHLLVLAIERSALALPTKKLLLEVLSTCAETAQQQSERTTMISLGCQVALLRWAERLTLEPTKLLHTLQGLIEERLFHYEPNGPVIDGAWLTWNLAFDTWPCLAPHPHRRHRRQATDSPGETDLPIDTPEPAPWSPQEVFARRWKGRPPRSVWWVLRQAVLERDDYTCVYCGRRGGRLTLDHVLPVSRGGTSDLSNLVAACVSCNSAKGTKTPQEWLVALQRGVGR